MSYSRDAPIYINITAFNFGPTTPSNDANLVQVCLLSEFNTSECSGVVVIEENSLISCLAEPDLGPSTIIVTVDGVDSLPHNITFTHYNDPGSFFFEMPIFEVSEKEYFAHVTIVRTDAPPFPSPVSVHLTAFDGTAISGSHYEASNQSIFLDSRETRAVFQINITFQDFLPENLRKGKEDDVEINLRIAEVVPLHGEVNQIGDDAILKIKALCQVVSHVCLADFNVLTNKIMYIRTDEL